MESLSVAATVFELQLHNFAKSVLLKQYCSNKINFAGTKQPPIFVVKICTAAKRAGGFGFGRHLQSLQTGYQFCRALSALELSESRGGRPGLPVPT